MREYEAMLVLSAELDDEEVNGAVERVSDILARVGGELSFSGQLLNRKGRTAALDGEWKPRKLAYAIKGQTEGYYVVLRFSGEPLTPEELERAWRLDESVLRYLVLRAEEIQQAGEPETEAEPE
jgi:small subunit ribosomal protein S6